ncbi:hemerythrin domain-containing protein [Usitatibacter palustris]|uniref:Hemerythrin-like domain-containing protein n=1 Tax=Usitatibacter palustris TaxID=2732487 RepID=A0A6M4H866_9PROT|nr:hemerythrin domain-containing protein [Usitatibacter palustris]QJR15879.1 hypothetical protein DSM104440_02705 [Usitatibacter palustris]
MGTQQAPLDAIGFLRADRHRLEEMIAEFRMLHEAQPKGFHSAKQRIMDDFCLGLKIHLRIEEELLFPAARRGIFGMETYLREAHAEHMGMRYFIAQVEAGTAENGLTCTRFLVLADQIAHHREIEEEELFPRVEQSAVDTAALGVALANRRTQLFAELSDDPATGAMHHHTSVERLTALRAAM